MNSRSRARSTSRCISSGVATAVVGLCGNETITTRGAGCAARTASSIAREQVVVGSSARVDDGGAGEARRDEMDRVARARDDRAVAALEQHPHQVGQALLRADRADHVHVGVERDAEPAPVALADGLAEVRQPAARGVAVVHRLRRRPRRASRPRSRARECPGCRSRGRSRRDPRAAARASAGRRSRRRREGDRGFAETASSVRERGTAMPVDVLRCRICESDYPALANGICVRCFGPLEPVYDWDELRGVVTRERIEAGPRSLWRYADLLPVAEPPENAEPRPASRRSFPRRGSRARSASGEVYLKLDLANPTHSFKDRVVAVAAAKAKEFGLETLSCTSTGNLANAVAARAAAEGMRAVIFCPAGLEPEKMQATTVYGARVYARARQLRRLLAADQRVRGRGRRLGHRQRQPALVLRRGLEDARVRDRRAARLGRADRGRGADRLGRDVHQALAGLRAVRPARADRRAPAAPLRRPGRGLLAGRVGVREERRVSPVRPNSVAKSLAIGNPADGDLAIATARKSGGAIYAVPEDEVGAEHGVPGRERRDLRRDGRRCDRRRASRRRGARRHRRVGSRRRARHRHRA